MALTRVVMRRRFHPGPVPWQFVLVQFSGNDFPCMMHDVRAAKSQRDSTQCSEETSR